MPKFIIAMTLFLQLLLQTECLDFGDSCIAGVRSGSCLPLSKCRSIVDEINRAGNPMPIHMRDKLQKLTCGFHSREPMVCCAGFEDTAKPVRGGIVEHADDSINLVVDGHNVETFPSANVQDKSGPVAVDRHPNLNLLPLNCGKFESDRIWGGSTTRLYEMPWMVLLSYTSRENKLSCGGSLINERYVLTAAHCVAFLGSTLQLNGVILGEYDIRQDPDCQMSNGKKYCAPKVTNGTIDSVVAHPGYTPQSLVDDIALIRLAEPVDFNQNSMKPLCLPITSALQTEYLVGLNGTVAGWGVTEYGIQSPVLLSVELPITSRKDCQIAYKSSSRIKEKQLCAGGVIDKDACAADSGGPLMYPGNLGTHGYRYIQRGIVSYGSKRCGIDGFPGIYTNVAYYMDWILDNMYS